MDTPKLGKLVVGNSCRDAVHIAIAPVEADGAFLPGQAVGLRYGKAVSERPYVGIVDPFLPLMVTKGERFWLCLYPGTITSLRHEWVHPAFPEEDRPAICTKQEFLESERWLAEFGEKYVISLEQMLAEANGALAGEQFSLCFGNDDGPRVMWEAETASEFFGHLENVVGQRIPRSVRENASYRCGC